MSRSRRLWAMVAIAFAAFVLLGSIDEALGAALPWIIGLIAERRGLGTLAPSLVSALMLPTLNLVCDRGHM